MDPQLLDLVWAIHRETGSREYIHVVSAYRSPGTNDMLRSRSSGVAKNSQHTQGKAMDFFIPGVPLDKLRAIAMKMQGGGVGYYPKLRLALRPCRHRQRARLAAHVAPAACRALPERQYAASSGRRQAASGLRAGGRAAASPRAAPPSPTSKRRPMTTDAGGDPRAKAWAAG